MTVLQRHYLMSAIGVDCGVVIPVVIVGLVEWFRGGQRFDDFTRSNAPAETAAGLSTASQEDAGVMALHDAPRTVPEIRFADGDVAAVALLSGVAYTVFSEWLNTEVRGSWPYAEAMPQLPFVGAGISPLVQWIVVPLIAFWWASARSQLEKETTYDH